MSRRILRNWIIVMLCMAALAALTWTGVSWRPARQDTPYTLLYYYQFGCKACREIEPVIDALEERYPGCITVRRLNVQWWRTPNVQGTPTVLLVDSAGQEVARWVGVRPARDFTGRIDSLCKS